MPHGHGRGGMGGDCRGVRLRDSAIGQSLAAAVGPDRTANKDRLAARAEWPGGFGTCVPGTPKRPQASSRSCLTCPLPPGPGATSTPPHGNRQPSSTTPPQLAIAPTTRTTSCKCLKSEPGRHTRITTAGLGPILNFRTTRDPTPGITRPRYPTHSTASETQPLDNAAPHPPRHQPARNLRARVAGYPHRGANLLALQS